MKCLLQAIATYAQMLAQSHFFAYSFNQILLSNVGVELA